MDVLPPEQLDRLRAAAEAARSAHYAPYSRVIALAAALTAEDHIDGGANIESANLTLTKHAEEVAILRALALDDAPPSPTSLACVYIAGPTPCGSCRQFAAEFGPASARWVVEPLTQEEILETSLVDLPSDRQPWVVSFAEIQGPFPFTPGTLAESERLHGGRASAAMLGPTTE
jgi:cytidine deaminase